MSGLDVLAEVAEERALLGDLSHATNGKLCAAARTILGA